MLKLVDEIDPILKKPCPIFDFSAPVVDYDSAKEYLIDLTNNMFPLMWASKGIGLAAPQIGLSLRMFIMTINKEDIVCINPEILEYGEEYAILPEGCLSFPNLVFNVKRPLSIYVSYQGFDGTVIHRHLNDLASRCFCHELDHLNGITFDSKVAKLSLRMAKDRAKQLLKQKLRRGN